MQKEFLTIADFQERFSIGRTRTYQLLRQGRIEACKMGGRTLIKAASALAWAKSLPAYQPQHRDSDERAEVSA